jgi:hypothetical protein
VSVANRLVVGLEEPDVLASAGGANARAVGDATVLCLQLGERLGTRKVNINDHITARAGPRTDAEDFTIAQVCLCLGEHGSDRLGVARAVLMPVHGEGSLIGAALLVVPANRYRERRHASGDESRQGDRELGHQRAATLLTV